MGQVSLAKRAKTMKALGHPSRLLIAEILSSGERCVCDLQEIIGADLSTVSKHLTLMRKAGILNCEKRGLNVYYSLSCSCFGELISCLDKIARGGKRRVCR
jgi:DNA-binding transcriptional ArsR family regulator